MAGLDHRTLLLELFETAVHAAHPAACLDGHLPPVPTDGRLIILAAGKAAAAMGDVACQHYQAEIGQGRVTGCFTPPHGYAAALGVQWPSAFVLMEGRHPTPDDASVAAADRALALAGDATAKDCVLILLSGGASALWAAPAGIDIAAKTALTRGLLKSGADIHQMNAVRRHLSRIKGGRLALAAQRAGSVLTLAISDVAGDDPATIGSGPSVPDPTTLLDAIAVLDRLSPRMAALGLDVPEAVQTALRDPANETPKPGHPVFSRCDYRIVATPRQALDAAIARAREAGYSVIDLGDQVTGEAREVARDHACLALEALQRGERTAIISGGELEVTVRNRNGRGGRAQEYALALALAIKGKRGIAALAGDTDGIDGGGGQVTDPAGAVVDWQTVEDATARGLDAVAALDDNDATTFFENASGLIVRGPTHTNINDFRAVLVDPDIRG
ncbi:MAG: glycerate kinase [Hyphomicrobiaceae bacterium]